MVGLIAGGEGALRHGVEDAEDDGAQGVADVQAIDLNERDVLVGIAASGRTPYTLAAMEYARALGATVGCIVNSPGSPMAEVARHPIVVLAGPEVVTGSTRMKSGTAQKLVLNMLSTGTMIRLGKVYGNLMVDVQPTNRKLVQRALDIVVAATGVSVEEARQALATYGGAKAAICGLLTGLDGEQVTTLLAQHHGHLKNRWLGRRSGDNSIPGEPYACQIGALSPDPYVEQKRVAAEYAAQFIISGMRVGLGSGSAAIFLTRRVGELLRTGELRDIAAFAPSKGTLAEAVALGIPLLGDDLPGELDIAIDGADEVDPEINALKGGGGALLREKSWRRPAGASCWWWTSARCPRSWAPTGPW